MTEIPYLESLSKDSLSRHSLDEIATAIADHGVWESFDEWRISTVTEKRIEKIQRDGRIWFRVQVKCDHDFTCHCPPIERAAEMLGIYDRIIMDLFYTVGWPSWAKHKQMES